MAYSTAEFEALYIQCFPAAMKLALCLLHDREEARDVAQEVFVKLWEANVRVDNAPAFVVRAVRNACLNRMRMLGVREKVHQRIMLDSPPGDFNPEEHAEEVMLAVRNLLTSREQEVVDRVYASGMTYKEAAQSLEVSVAAVNKHVVSALKKLRNHFKTGKP